MPNPFNSYGKPEEKAKSLLFHYIEVAKGSELGSDCHQEIGEIIDCILEAVEARTPEYRLNRLEKSLSYLKNKVKESTEKLEKTQLLLIELGSQNLEAIPEELREKIVQLDDELSDYLSD